MPEITGETIDVTDKFGNTKTLMLVDEIERNGNCYLAFAEIPNDRVESDSLDLYAYKVMPSETNPDEDILQEIEHDIERDAVVEIFSYRFQMKWQILYAMEAGSSEEANAVSGSAADEVSAGENGNVNRGTVRLKKADGDLSSRLSALNIDDEIFFED